MKHLLRTFLVFSLIILAGYGCSHTAESTGMQNKPVDIMDAAALIGPTWQLVKFEGGDETVLTNNDPGRYTLTFFPDNRVAAQIFCNRGMGTWSSTEPAQLKFGPIATTRMMCPPDPLQDRLIRDLDFVRSFIIRDGHLYLSLMADGGIYEFRPAP